MHLIYYKTTGELWGYIDDCSSDLLQLNIENLPNDFELFMYGGTVDNRTHYYDLVNTVRPRPIIEAEPNQTVLLANSPDSIVISGLPVPCVIKDGDKEYPMTDPEDTTFEFTADTVGVYRITCEAWPHIPKSWEVEAV